MCVGLGIVLPFNPHPLTPLPHPHPQPPITSWDLDPRQYLSGDISALNKFIKKYMISPWSICYDLKGWCHCPVVAQYVHSSAI